MTTLQLEGRLRQAAASYRRMVPAAPRLEPRILAQVAVTPRPPSQRGLGGGSLALQLGATIALVAFAVGVAFFIRESRLHQPAQPVSPPTPSVTASFLKPGAGSGSYKFSVFGMGMWHPGGDMVTPTVGWGTGNLLSRTTDGGVHWTIVTPTQLRNPNLNIQSEYLDATHAWIVQDLPDQIDVFRTADAGQTWQHGAPIMRSHSTTVQLDFVDPIHGWLFPSENGFGGGPFDLYRTADGGLHWQQVSVSSIRAAGNPGTFACQQWCLISFASPTAGTLVNLNTVNTDSGMTLLRTHDGGVTWTRVSLPLSALRAQCPCFVDRPVFLDGIHGFLVVWSAGGPAGGPIIGHLLVSADAGNTWSARTLPGEAETDIGFSDPLHGWAIAGSVSDIGSLMYATGPDLPLPLYRTDDGGITWVRIPNGLNLRSTTSETHAVEFIDQNIGFAYSLQSGRPRWLETMDGGRTWVPIRRTVPPSLATG